MEMALKDPPAFDVLDQWGFQVKDYTKNGLMSLGDPSSGLSCNLQSVKHVVELDFQGISCSTKTWEANGHGIFARAERCCCSLCSSLDCME